MDEAMGKSQKKTTLRTESNKFNVKRVEQNENEKNEKTPKKIDISIPHDNANMKPKENLEDSNEILEEIELNNIADDNKDADNVVLDFKNDFLPKETEKKIFKHEISLKRGDSKISNDPNGTSQKIHEIESITIEIRNKNNQETDSKSKSKSKEINGMESPPSVSSRNLKFEKF